ncbi:MAG: RNA polymerase sigma factor [Candidatus Eisenbacteria bacterium]|nr:RNA polymerase sigma factor [Candidatus Eisenbacteria bacterium]
MEPEALTPAPTLTGIYEAYHRKVVAYAAKLLGSDLGEDIAQDVFVKVGRSLDTLSDDAKLTSWIYAITINTVRDHARKHGAGRLVEAGAARGTGEEPGDPLLRLPDTTSPSPEQSAIRSEMVACYLDYVRRLPRRYYVVYALSELEDLSNQEIADRLSLSLGTVKIRLHRARALLYGELRRNCRCYRDERGELMGEPADRSSDEP